MKRNIGAGLYNAADDSIQVSTGTPAFGCFITAMVDFIGAFYVLQYVWDKKTAVNIEVFWRTSAAVALAFMFLSDLNVYRNTILSCIALISLILVFRKQAMPRTINFLGKISF